jgi:FHA domain-containing protein
MSNTKLALSFRIFKNGQLLREDKLTQGVIKIGKVPSAHLRIDDDSVSRMHAVIEVTNKDVSLIDLGSTRGTFVNDKKINKATLQSGDVITVGEVRVEVTIGEAEPVRRAPAASVASVASVASRPAAMASATPSAGAPVAASGSIAAQSSPPAPVMALHSVLVSDAALAAVATPPPIPTLRSVPGATPPPPLARHTPAAPARPLARSVAMPLDTAANPVGLQRVIAESADELGGAGAVEVAAMLGDSVIAVKHCVDPRGGKVTPATWGLLAAGVLCLLGSAIAFVVSVRNAAETTARRDTWTRIQHRPERAFRPVPLGAGIDWMAFGGLALGLAGVTLGVWRIRGERSSPYYRIGTAPGVEAAIEGAPLPAFPLIAPSGDDFVFNYGAGIDGELIVDGKSTPLAELAAMGRSRPSPSTAGAIEVPIPPKARIRARAGQITFLVSAVARPRRHAAPLLAHLESRALSYVAGSLLVHLGIWALLQAVPLDESVAGIELPTSDDPTMRIQGIVQADPAPDKPTEGASAGNGQPNPTTAMELPPGASGSPHATKVDGRMEVMRRDDQPRMSQDEAIRIAIKEGILGSDELLSSVRVLGGTRNIASGFDERDMNGAIYGAEGEGWGHFGGGVRGPGGGGGCLAGPCGTIGTRPGYGRIGTDPRAGGYGIPGSDGPFGRRHQPTAPDIGKPVISNPTYDKSIVRRYIRRHLNEIGYCYEKQLLAHPNIGGEVKMVFFIAPNGSVQSSSGAGFDSEVASCLAGVIKTIEFPAPGDGGSVQVNYPFLFHAPGH